MSDIEIPQIEPAASPATSTPWVPLWPLAPSTLGELAYAEATANKTVTQTADASADLVVAAPAITLDGQTTILVTLCAPVAVPPATAGQGLWAVLFDNGAPLGRMGAVITPAAATAGAPILAQRRLTPAAGSHQFSFAAIVQSGSGTIYAGSGGSGVYVPAHIRVSLAAPTAAPVHNPSYGTSFPASPPDGQEHVLVDSVTNPSYQWRFRYNASSTSPYKWEFVGGTHAYRVVETSEAIVSPSGSVPSDTATVGPSFTVPYAGDYWIEYAAQITAPGASPTNFLVGVAYAAGALQGSVPTSWIPTTGQVGLFPYFVRLAAVPSATELRLRYQSAQAINVANRRLAVIPVRVS
jgi:hypothetical protein